MKKYILALLLLGVIFAPTSALAESAHSVGTNIVDKKGTVYLIQETNSRINGYAIIKYKTPYTSAGAFLSYKFNSFQNVQTANTADLSLPLYNDLTGPVQFISPRPGSLINDKGTVYIITSYARTGFTSEAVFKGLGYSYSNVYKGDTSFLHTDTPINSNSQQHPAGTLIKDKGTLYIMHFGSKIGVPTIKALESWGYWTNEAVIATSYDITTNESNVLDIRANDQFSFFFTYQ